MGGDTKIYCGDNVWFGRNSFVGGNKGRINIGNNVHLAYGVIVISYNSINIGDDVLIGEYTSIRDHDHNFKKGKLIREQELKTASVVIESNVWIGKGCTILKGVTIKTGSVIGANSLVNMDIPEYSVAAGTPAKIIKNID
jgi:acetyltransferase-like isoleucine patch superfamily enzyme